MIRRGAALASALLFPVVLAAQVRGMPVVNSGFGLGAGVAVDAGFANDAAGGGTTLAATATTGLGFLGVSAAVSRGTVDDQTVWSPGVAVSLRVFGGPLVPLRVTLQGGAGQWNQGVVSTLHVPVSLGIAVVIPNPVFAIRPWLAPRIDYLTTSFGNSEHSATEFGVSGGIELGFLSGITVRAAYDRLFVDGDPGILSVGLGVSLGR